MITELTLNKPEALQLDRTKLLGFDSNSSVKRAILELEAGTHLLITDYYSDGLTLLSELKSHLKRQFSGHTIKEQREYRAAYHKLSNLILTEIKDHQLPLKKAPSIGWLKELYPETSDFFLSFPQVQGLNSSWQWYEKGIMTPVLRNKLHPYYGTFFPTKFDHLILFDNWLKRYEGPKKSAIDVGVGSGVLSLQIIKHGFQKVFGTDTNPNAIFGLSESMKGTKMSRKIELDFAHLFGKWEKQTELIVFNPPWLPQSHNSGRVDAATYYNRQLFPEFFEEAKKRLLPGGKLVVIFSNIAQITNVTKAHPIKKELAEGGRFELEKCYTRSVKSVSDKTRRHQSWRDLEEVELWELKHK